MSRKTHIEKVNAIRSASAKAMLDMLDELEHGGDGDFGGFKSFNITYSFLIKRQLNSYRAKKICNACNKNLSKNDLLRYAKSKDYLFKVSSKEFNYWLESNKDALNKYFAFAEKVAITNL